MRPPIRSRGFSPRPRRHEATVPDKGKLWVELLGRYSKMPPPLAVKLDARARKPKAARPGVHAARRRLSPETVAARGRLSPETVNQLVADYEAGKSSTVLMKTYDLGEAQS